MGNRGGELRNLARDEAAMVPEAGRKRVPGFLLDPGVLLARSDFNGSGWRPKGMHGYHPDDPYSDGIFLSNRPPQRPLGSITDLFGWMREAGGNG